MPPNPRPDALGHLGRQGLGVPGCGNLQQQLHGSPVAVNLLSLFTGGFQVRYALRYPTRTPHPAQVWHGFKPRRTARRTASATG